MEDFSPDTYCWVGLRAVLRGKGGVGICRRFCKNKQTNKKAWVVKHQKISAS